MGLVFDKLDNNTWVLRDGNTILVEAKSSNGSGHINIRGTLYEGADLVSPSATELAALDGMTHIAQGVADGYRIARSAAPVALDGSNPTTVASGLTTIVACGACLAGTDAPGLGTAVLSTAISGTNINVYAWKPTDATDPTLIASDGEETFHWWAIGT